MLLVVYTEIRETDPIIFVYSHFVKFDTENCAIFSYTDKVTIPVNDFSGLVTIKKGLNDLTSHGPQQKTSVPG